MTSKAQIGGTLGMLTIRFSLSSSTRSTPFSRVRHCPDRVYFMGSRLDLSCKIRTGGIYLVDVVCGSVLP